MANSRATLNDVAKRSGYALRTVKKVMSGAENVREKTRLDVLQSAAELNYQRNMLASALSKSKKCRIAIVYAEITKHYFPEVEQGFMKCSEELRDFGLTVEIHKIYSSDAEYQIAKLRDLLMDEGIDGLIIQPCDKERLVPYIDMFVKAGKPVVTFGADAPSSNRMCYIGPDAYKSGRIGAQILANYVGKRGNVAIISANNEHMQTVDRVRGFTDRVNEHYPQINITNLNIPFNSASYYEIIRNIVATGSYQGIFCTDANTYIAGEVLHDSNRKDIVVVGFDMSNLTEILMKQGYIKVILEQNPYQFSHSALRIMYEYFYLDMIPDKIQHTALSIMVSESL